METYKISQIAKLLGLSSDTIRFYEKKGLVHPSVNPDNLYREYDLDNILELLDIIYYRHLDISCLLYTSTKRGKETADSGKAD